MASSLFNKANGIRFATAAKDKPLPVGQLPTEETRRAHFTALSTDAAARNGGMVLVAAYRRAYC